MSTDNNMTIFKTSAQLKAHARGLLVGKYRIVIFSYVVIQIITSAIMQFAIYNTNTRSFVSVLTFFAISALTSLLSGVFYVGQNYLHLNITRRKEYGPADILKGFRDHSTKAIIIQSILFTSNIITSLPIVIFTLRLDFNQILSSFNYTVLIYFIFLLSVSLIINIMIQLNLFPALYLLVDYPDEAPMSLIKHSISMMRGHKKRLFYINLSFIGLNFIALLTLQIGALWVSPYMNMTLTNFYEELYQNEQSRL